MRGVKQQIFYGCILWVTFVNLELQILIMIIEGVNIDRLAQEILSVVDNNEDGVMNTVEVQNSVKSSDNKRVKYRFDKLEDADLIEVERDRKDGSRSLPNRAAITLLGEELVESYELEFGDADDPNETLRQRVERAERERTRLQKQNENLYVVLGVLFRDLGIDTELVEAYGVDSDRMGKPGERSGG